MRQQVTDGRKVKESRATDFIPHFCAVQIHGKIARISSEWLLNLSRNAFDSKQSESAHRDEGDGPPSHQIDQRERQGEEEE